MVSSLMEDGARSFVTRFLRSFITNGTLVLLEDDGSTLSFEGSTKRCALKILLKIHNPLFYWKVLTRGSIGLADAYIAGDFSVDGKEGLLDLCMVLITNRDANRYNSIIHEKRGSWTRFFLTAGIATAKLVFQQVFTRNSLTQARRNISRHYDLNNDFFASFMDDTMLYSTAIFKTEDEDLKTAQLRKISVLIKKARIKKDQEVLEIGCGWGTFAIEVVKQTGCKYTGITLSEEQLKYAEAKVMKLGLQDKIEFLLCDYRELPKTRKYDSIISCEMIEHVGHEYMEEFFGCCESLLAEDGLFVLQFTTVPDDCYEEERKSPGFITEYFFPGGCLPSFSRITSAMAAKSNLRVEHAENIGGHYPTTLKKWRQNLLDNQSKIKEMGYDETFIRTWQYYFDYTSAGFKSYTLGNYQVVFSRPGNQTTLGDPFKGFPSANCGCYEEN